MDRRIISPLDKRKWNHGTALDGRIELIGNPGCEWVTYFFDFDPENNSVLRWSNDYGCTWHENIPITDGLIPVTDGLSLKIHDFPERKWGCTAARSLR